MFVDMEILDSTRGSKIYVSQNGTTNGGLGEGNATSHIEGVEDGCGSISSREDDMKHSLRGDLIHISNGEEDVETNDNFQEVPPPPRKAKRNYVSTCKF